MPSVGAAFNMADFEVQGRELQARARARAAGIVAAAQAQAARIVEDSKKTGFEAGRAEGASSGREAGFKVGHEEGLRSAREATATMAQSLLAMVKEISTRREAIVKQAERDLLKLAVAVASRVVRRELKVDGEAVARAVIEAAGLAAERSRLTIRVNPADLAAAQAAQPELVRAFSDIQDLKFAADEAVERGGCRLLTESGEVDLQVATQLARLEKLLTGEAEIVGEGGQ
jgi:flagellar assembly protein FliH